MPVEVPRLCSRLDYRRNTNKLSACSGKQAECLQRKTNRAPAAENKPSTCSGKTHLAVGFLGQRLSGRSHRSPALGKVGGSRFGQLFLMLRAPALAKHVRQVVMICTGLLRSAYVPEKGGAG